MMQAKEANEKTRFVISVVRGDDIYVHISILILVKLLEIIN